MVPGAVWRAGGRNREQTEPLWKPRGIRSNTSVFSAEVWNQLSFGNAFHTEETQIFPFLPVKPLEKCSSAVCSCGPANASPRMEHCSLTGRRAARQVRERAQTRVGLPTNAQFPPPGRSLIREAPPLIRRPSPCSAAGTHGNHLGALKTTAVWILHLEVLMKSVWFGMQPRLEGFCGSLGDSNVKPALGATPCGSSPQGNTRRGSLASAGAMRPAPCSAVTH